VNTDRADVGRFLQGDRSPTPITGNPLARDLGGQILELDASAGRAVLAFTPGPQFLQGGQVIQGGIVAAMLDFAMAYATHARLTEERAFATATLTVNFMSAAISQRYLARGEVRRLGRRLVHAQSELVAPDGRLIASASSVMSLLDP